MKKLSSRRGFTIIELMIALVIVALLVAVAIPSYQSYVMKGYRSDAIKDVTAVLQAQERYYSDNYTYTTDLSDLGYANSTLSTSDNRYVISAAACGSTALTQCIQVTATAQGSQAGDGNLVVDTTGTQTRSLNGSSYSW